MPLRECLGLPAGRVVLRRAHVEWAAAFELERTRIVDAVGRRVRRIEHVGSTAIPDVPAKPVLDLLVGVDELEAASSCIEPLAVIGYRHRGEHGIPGRRYFVKGSPRTHHLHLVELGGEFWRSMLGFRNLLTGDPSSARAYAEAKRILADRFPRDRKAYQREKDAVIERLLRAGASFEARDGARRSR